MAKGRVDLDALYKNYLPSDEKIENTEKSTVTDNKSTPESTPKKNPESTPKKNPESTPKKNPENTPKMDSENAPKSTQKRNSKSTTKNTSRENKTSQITLKVKPSLKKLFEESCAEEGESVNGKTTELIKAYLKKQKKL